MAIPSLIVAHPDPAAARAQQRALQSGELVRVGHGSFVTRGDWEASTEWERHLARAVAVQRCSPWCVVSHASAVIAHGLPWILPAPTRVVVTDPARSVGQRTRFADKVKGVGRDLRVVTVGGLRVTDLPTTAVDVVLRHDRARGLAVADAVLRRGVARPVLLDEAAARGSVRAHRRLGAVLELASGLSESAGESVTNLAMRDLGLPAPVQQQVFRDAEGIIGRVDFWFPDHGVIVEFDGLAKYRDPTLRNGRTADEAVIMEKLREDRLRAIDSVRHVVRPIWRDVVPGGKLPRMLAAAGLPVRRGIVETLPW